MTARAAVKYRRLAGTILPKVSRDVLVDGGTGIHFRCPCGERRVYVTSPPHHYEFADDGVLTIAESCGYRANEKLNRPAGWCHFHIKKGEPAMCKGVQCPGGALLV